MKGNRASLPGGEKEPSEKRKREKKPVGERIIELGLLLSSTLDLDNLLNTIVKESASIFESEGASLLLFDEEKCSLCFTHVVSFLDRERLKDVTLKKGEGIAGYVIDRGEAVIVDDVQNDPRFSQKADKITGSKTKNIMAVPLTVKAKALGVMEVINKKSGVFNRQELAAAQTLAGFAAVAIENARLHGQVKENLDKITRLESTKHELISLLSHELRTPVTLILTSSMLLCNHLPKLDKEMISQTADMIATRSLRLASLIDDLFVINDIDEIRDRLVIEEIPIMEMIELAAVKFRRSLTKHTIEVQIPQDDRLPPLRADRLKLQHCIFHLIENAIKFSPQGGAISIRVYLDRSTPPTYYIEVEDPGIGVAEDHIEKIFQKFYQVESGSTRRFGGLGLGLFICKRVAEVHQGDIKCVSVPDKGSRFIFSLPSHQKSYNSSVSKPLNKKSRNS